jgi:hypothetical protein
VRPSALARLGRVIKGRSAGSALTTGLLGRLGRVFETHLEREREPPRRENHNADERQLNECRKGVLAVLSDPIATPQSPLSERERALLMRWCGTDDPPPIIREARRLFNATITGIGSSDEKLHVEPDWVQMSFLPTER